MTTRPDILRTQLVERRERLQEARRRSDAAQFADLLKEVDSALDRMENGTFGICETCHDPIEADRVMADPLVRYCLDHLTPTEQRALEQDLQLAARVQSGLLPQRHLQSPPWEVVYHYEPSGPVSGDYCDLVKADGGLFVLLGDAAGKGVAASMLMAHLHAIFRTLIGMELPVGELIARANRIFCGSTLAQHFATLVCARATAAGELELCNAGHCQPLIVGCRGIIPMEASGLPLGVFADSRYDTVRVQLEPGESLFLCSDGLLEAANGDGEEYGRARLQALLGHCRELAPEALIQCCLEDLGKHCAAISDDLTMMAIRRQP